jgi:hypothetical protein
MELIMPPSTPPSSPLATGMPITPPTPLVQGKLFFE